MSVRTQSGALVVTLALVALVAVSATNLLACGGSGGSRDGSAPGPAISIPEPPADDGVVQIYFVDSESGDDDNDGLSEARPWRTLDPIGEVPLSSGDGVRLKRGGEYPGILDLVAAGSADDPITIEPYGEGSQPRITGLLCMSPACGNDSVTWTHAVDDIYQAHVEFVPGVVVLDDQALQFVNFDSLESARARMTPGSFVFEPETSTLFVHTPTGVSPADIEIMAARAPFNIRLTGSRHVRIRDLALRGSRRHCVLATHSTDIDLAGLTIDFCGGQWDEGGGFYLGNGVEIAGASARLTVRDSTLTDIFDSCVSPQAYLWSDFTIEDVSITGNDLRRCGLAGVEVTVWAVAAAQRSVVVEANTIVDIGGGWAGRYNTNHMGGVGVVAMAPDPSSTISELSIRGNEISGGTLDGIALGFDAGHVVIDGNMIRDNAGVGVFAWDDDAETTTSARLTNNTITGHGGSGVSFALAGGPGVEVGEGNVIEANETDGVPTDPNEHTNEYRAD